MDLVRDLLFAIEELEWEGAEHLEFTYPSRDRLEVAYHLQLLEEAGLIVGNRTDTMSIGPEFYPERLTWEGHEFLDAARNATTWKKVKGILVDKGAGLAFTTLKIALTAYADQVIKSALGTPLP